MVALTLLAYVIGLFVGEALRDMTDGANPPDQITYLDLIKPSDPEHGEQNGSIILDRLFF